MSVENGKVCCNCRYNFRTTDGKTSVTCICWIDKHYIGYTECMEGWCRHWSEEKERAKE